MLRAADDEKLGASSVPDHLNCESTAQQPLFKIQFHLFLLIFSNEMNTKTLIQFGLSLSGIFLGTAFLTAGMIANVGIGWGWGWGWVAFH
jgi:hypothetical protein